MSLDNFGFTKLKPHSDENDKPFIRISFFSSNKTTIANIYRQTMKKFNKIPVAIFLTVCFFFCLILHAKAQEQVVIKGSSTSTTYEGIIDETIRSFAIEIYDKIIPSGHGDFLFGTGSPTVTSQNFTITYTQETMHMVGTIEPGPDQLFNSAVERNEYYEKNTMTMILRFNPEGTQLDMMIKVYGQSPMTMRVPKGNTIASSNTQSLLTPAPVSNMEINGFDAGKYNFYTEGELDLGGAVIPTPGGPTPKKLKKVEEGEVWLAPNAPGIGLMRGFYVNLTLGGYDLAGAEDGGIMALMDRLLERGMLIRAKETSIVSTFGPSDDEFIFKTVTDTNISSVIVEPFNEDILSISNDSQNPDSSSGSGSSTNPEEGSGSTSDSQTNIGSINSQNGPSTTPDDEGCDCSCEKYSEFIKLVEQSKKSKKSKKKSGEEMMQEMDMNCMQECIMQWTKCMMIKN